MMMPNATIDAWRIYSPSSLIEDTASNLSRRLWPSNTIWYHISGSTLPQWWLGAMNYLNQIYLSSVRPSAVNNCTGNPWEKNGHGELTVTTVVKAPGSNDHSSVTARLGHSSVTAQSRLGHSSVTGEVTAQSQRSWLGHSSITAQVTAQSPWAWSPWAHRELTVSSWWAVTVANFFSHGNVSKCNSS